MGFEGLEKYSGALDCGDLYTSCGRGRTQWGFHALWRPVCVLGAWINALWPLCTRRPGCVFGAWKNALGPLCSVETCVCFGSLEERTGALPGRTRWVISAVWKPVCILGTFKNALGPLFGFEGSTLSGPRIQSNPSDVNSCISSFASVAGQGFGYNVNIEA